MIQNTNWVFYKPTLNAVHMNKGMSRASKGMPECGYSLTVTQFTMID